MSTPDLLLQWSIAAATALVLLMRRQLTLFHAPTLFLLFHIVAHCLRPTLLHVTGSLGSWSTLGLPWDPEWFRQALWASSAALVAFSLGYLLATKRAAPLHPAAPRDWDTHDRRALGIVAALFLIPGGIAGYAAHETSHPAAFVLDAQSVLLAPAALAILAAGWRWWSLVPLAAWVWMRRTPAIPGDAMASTAVAVLVVAVLRLWQTGRRHPPAVLLGAASIAAIAVFTIDLGALTARWFSPGETPAAASGEPVWKRRLERPEAASFESLATVTALVPEKTGGYSYGAQHIAWIAEAKSHSGNIASRVLTTRARLQRHARIGRQPLTLAAEGWMSGGWTGLAITCATAGLIFGTIFSWFSRRQDAPAAAVLLAIAQGCALPWIALGGESGVRVLVAAAPPLLLWTYLSARFRRGAEAKNERERLREDRNRRRLLGDTNLHPHTAPLPPDASGKGLPSSVPIGAAAPDAGPDALAHSAAGETGSQAASQSGEADVAPELARPPVPPWRPPPRA